MGAYGPRECNGNKRTSCSKQAEARRRADALPGKTGPDQARQAKLIEARRANQLHSRLRSPSAPARFVFDRFDFV